MVRSLEWLSTTTSSVAACVWPRTLPRQASSVCPEFRVVTMTETVSCRSTDIGDLDILHGFGVGRGARIRSGDDGHTPTMGFDLASQDHPKLVGTALPRMCRRPLDAGRAHLLSPLRVFQQADQSLREGAMVTVGNQQPGDAITNRIAQTVDVRGDHRQAASAGLDA